MAPESAAIIGVRLVDHNRIIIGSSITRDSAPFQLSSRRVQISAIRRQLQMQMAQGFSVGFVSLSRGRFTDSARGRTTIVPTESRQFQGVM